MFTNKQTSGEVVEFKHCWAVILLKDLTLSGTNSTTCFRDILQSPGDMWKTPSLRPYKAARHNSGFMPAILYLLDIHAHNILSIRYSCPQYFIYFIFMPAIFYLFHIHALNTLSISAIFVRHLHLFQEARHKMKSKYIIFVRNWTRFFPSHQKKSGSTWEFGRV